MHTNDNTSTRCWVHVGVYTLGHRGGEGKYCSTAPCWQLHSSKCMYIHCIVDYDFFLGLIIVFVCVESRLTGGNINRGPDHLKIHK